MGVSISDDRRLWRADGEGFPLYEYHEEGVRDEMQPRCIRDAAEMQPRCSRDAAEYYEEGVRGYTEIEMTGTLRY